MAKLGDVQTVVHADWGSAPGKRWMCVAARTSRGFQVAAPQPVGETASLVERLHACGRGGATLIGFDFPIGLPVAYAQRVGIDDFPRALPTFGDGDWRDFYTLAEQAAEIGPRRPFYPRRPGGTCQQHLLDGLGVDDMHALLRRCERSTPARHAASPLFWTLGGKQVGRAAIVGWRDVVAPALAAQPDRVRLWPFHGDLAAIAGAGSVVMLETYPADACVQLGLPAPGRGWSKRSQAGRRAQGALLLVLSRRRRHAVDARLRRELADGFGSGADGEDRFDAVVGLLAMLDVVAGRRGDGAPQSPQVRRIEGWICGLQH
ncbi:MAG: DUF429 domain-containing protein [Gammaproteobacteria bacterium]|nr:DUF429 domain-containing protein [Gammaproteobacteria bacterium]